MLVDDVMCLVKTYVKNFPLSSLSGLATNLAMTWPGCSGLSRVPSSLAFAKVSYWALSIVSLPADLRTACIPVSTLPGAIATLVMSGSSIAMCAEMELHAALDEP